MPFVRDALYLPAVTTTTEATDWVCAALFEFASGKSEHRVLLHDTEERCVALSRQLERRNEEGRRLIYSDDPDVEVPIHYTLAVCRAEDA